MGGNLTTVCEAITVVPGQSYAYYAFSHAQHPPELMMLFGVAATVGTWLHVCTVCMGPTI